jgi:hypothetical protein
MSSVKTIAQLRQLRQQPLWKLLASHNAPIVLAVLQELLLGEHKIMPASALHERLTQELQRLKQAGEEIPPSAQVHVAAWLSEGWLTRRLPAGAQEEQYELTTDAVTAIRFLQGVLQPRVLATESRLATVMQQLTKLAEDTNPDPGSRRQALLAERARIDRQLDDLGRGVVETLPTERDFDASRLTVGALSRIFATSKSPRRVIWSLARPAPARARCWMATHRC